MKVIARIKGGLGNQLFCYAAARRLALVNNSELVIDSVSGFAHDRIYRRKYLLDHFQVPCRKATYTERLEPFARYRRYLAKVLSRDRPFIERKYLEQEIEGFDERLLTLKPQDNIYIDGLWQHEDYFKDVEHMIRKDLTIIPPTDSLNLRSGEMIQTCNAIGLHVRWFDAPNSAAINNITAEYYRRAIALIVENVESPCFFLFSDNTAAARNKLGLDSHRVISMDHNVGDESAFADLWLMTLCKHFITANSTFSWWGAWLGRHSENIITFPKLEAGTDGKTPWHLSGDMPKRWIGI